MKIELSYYRFQSNVIKLNKICVFYSYGYYVFVDFWQPYLVSFELLLLNILLQRFKVFLVGTSSPHISENGLHCNRLAYVINLSDQYILHKIDNVKMQVLALHTDLIEIHWNDIVDAHREQLVASKHFLDVDLVAFLI